MSKKEERTPVSNKSEWCSPDSNIHFITEKSCPMSIDLVKSALARDKSMHVLKQIIYKGWPSQRHECPKELWEYWNHRCDLTLEDCVILKSDRVVVPESLRGQVLDLIHSGHQGETGSPYSGPASPETFAKWSRHVSNATNTNKHNRNCQQSNPSYLRDLGRNWVLISSSSMGQDT